MVPGAASLGQSCQLTTFLNPERIERRCLAPVFAVLKTNRQPQWGSTYSPSRASRAALRPFASILVSSISFGEEPLAVSSRLSKPPETLARRWSWAAIGRFRLCRGGTANLPEPHRPSNPALGRG